MKRGKSLEPFNQSASCDGIEVFLLLSDFCLWCTLRSNRRAVLGFPKCAKAKWTWMLKSGMFANNKDRYWSISSFLKTESMQRVWRCQGLDFLVTQGIHSPTLTLQTGLKLQVMMLRPCWRKWPGGPKHCATVFKGTSNLRTNSELPDAIRLGQVG